LDLLNVCDTVLNTLEYLQVKPRYDMHIQDKIGRDMAKEILDNFESVHQNDPKKIEIFINTKLYKFFLNKPTFKSEDGDTFQLPRMKRTVQTGKIIFPMELDKCLAAEVITEDQYKFAMDLSLSEDEGDMAILEGSVNVWRDQRKKKERRKK